MQRRGNAAIKGTNDTIGPNKYNRENLHIRGYTGALGAPQIKLSIDQSRQWHAFWYRIQQSWSRSTITMGL